MSEEIRKPEPDPWERIDDGTYVSGAFHGGAMAVLFDRALGLNSALLRPGQRMATASLTVNFLRSVRIGDFITISCAITKQGRKATFGHAFAHVGAELVATATGVFMTVDKDRSDPRRI
jgi:uncharacterized protein (TIGR00369 family)